MSTLLFDCETDGLLPSLSKLHCLAIQDADTGALWSYADQKGHTPIVDGLKKLAEADSIVAHNALGFDVPAIQKVYSGWAPQGRVIDSLLM